MDVNDFTFKEIGISEIISIEGVNMTEADEAECKYCGAVLELTRVVQLNPETEEFDYRCVNCALAWEKKGKDPSQPRH